MSLLLCYAMLGAAARRQGGHVLAHADGRGPRAAPDVPSWKLPNPSTAGGDAAAALLWGTAFSICMEYRYEEAFNPRLVAALVDHEWDQLVVEGSESCGCRCFPLCV